MKFLLVFILMFNFAFATQNEMSVKEVFEKKDRVILLDVRQPFEHKIGHIDGAIFLPLEELKDKIEMYSKDKFSEIIIYCLSGPRSLKAVETLKELGYEDVKWMQGGIKNWIKNKYPINR